MELVEFTASEIVGLSYVEINQKSKETKFFNRKVELNATS